MTIRSYTYKIRLFLKYIYIYNKKKKVILKDILLIDTYNLDIKTLEKITVDDINNFFTFLTIEKGNQQTSNYSTQIALKSFFGFLHNKKYINNNPTAKLEKPRIEKRNHIYLKLNEVEQLLYYCANDFSDKNRERNYAIISIFLNCGLRISEVCNIDTSDIDMYDWKLKIIGKGNKERIIYLNNSCRKAISQYLETKNKTIPLFTNSTGKRLGTNRVWEIVKEKIKLSGLDDNKYTPHKLRHTSATMMYQYGKVDILTIKDYLGHSNIKTTLIYTHSENKMVREACDSLPYSNFTNL